MESANKQNTGLPGFTQKSLNQSKSQFGGLTSAEDQTKHYLKIAKQKKMEEERALELTIDKSKRETEFDCLHKMGEACEIAK